MSRAGTPGGDGQHDRDGVRPPDPESVPDLDVLVVDNYDSFAYNLVQYVGEFAGEVTVRRNDAVDVADVRRLDPDAVVISPGPGRPEDAGVSTALFEEPDLPILGVCLGHQALCAARGAAVERAPTVVHGKPSTVEHDGTGLFAGLPDRLRVGRYHSLSVGRDALPEDLVESAWTVAGEADGGSSDPSGRVDVERPGDGRVDGRPDDGRVDDGRLDGGRPDDGRPDDGRVDERSIVMGVRHRDRPHVGVQFHPESILTGEVGGEEASLAVGKRLIARFCELAASYDADADGSFVDAAGRRSRSGAASEEVGDEVEDEVRVEVEDEVSDEVGGEVEDR